MKNNKQRESENTEQHLHVQQQYTKTKMPQHNTQINNCDTSPPQQPKENLHVQHRCIKKHIRNKASDTLGIQQPRTTPKEKSSTATKNERSLSINNHTCNTEIQKQQRPKKKTLNMFYNSKIDQ